MQNLYSICGAFQDINLAIPFGGFFILDDIDNKLEGSLIDEEYGEAKIKGTLDAYFLKFKKTYSDPKLLKLNYQFRKYEDTDFWVGSYSLEKGQEKGLVICQTQMTLGNISEKIMPRGIDINWNTIGSRFDTTKF
jgi:hypothetical protein